MAGPPEVRTFGPTHLSLDDLVELKGSRGVSITVCLPALNEGATIGRLCSLFRETLVERARLVDEIVVVDSGSSDETVRVATESGADVHYARDLVPAAGGRVFGKGDALWRSLSVIKGDIVVWLDSDTRNPHPGFVSDLLAPLLTDDALVFSKAFYERPLETEGALLATGGARVTELVARPLLGLFYPELAGMIQPLAGEYAGYTSVFSELPFFTGYGVDIGLLLDICERHGAERIAQVDLGRRIHRNRPTVELGRMAFEIMHAMFARLDELGRLKLGGEMPATFAQFEPSDGPPIRKDHELPVLERPPIAEMQLEG